MIQLDGGGHKSVVESGLRKDRTSADVEIMHDGPCLLNRVCWDPGLQEMELYADMCCLPQSKKNKTHIWKGSVYIRHLGCQLVFL